MKKLWIPIIAVAMFIMPSFAFAGEGDFTILTDVLDMSNTNLTLEYGWSGKLGIGVDYQTISSATVILPYFRYYFKGDESSLFLGAGYLMGTSGGSTQTTPTVGFGYNVDFSFLTLNIGYRSLLSQLNSGSLRLQVGVFF